MYGYSLFSYDTYGAVQGGTCSLAQLSRGQQYPMLYSPLTPEAIVATTGTTGTAGGGGIDNGRLLSIGVSQITGTPLIEKVASNHLLLLVR